MHRCWKLGLIAVLLVVPTGVMRAADEELPPPRDNGQAARRERLRRLGGQILDALAAPDGAAREGEPLLDIAKLNLGMQKFLASLGDRPGALLQSLQLSFDEQETNLAKDTVKLLASAVLDHSAWSPDPTKIQLGLHAHVERPEGVPMALLEGQLSLATDVVPLANFAVARLRDRLARKEETAVDTVGLPTAKQVFRSRLYEKLARTAPLHTLDDLADFLSQVAALWMQSLNEEIDALSTAVNEASDPDARQEMAARLNDSRIQRDRMFDCRPRILRDDQGRAVTIVLTLERSQPASGLDIDHLELAVSPNDVSVAAAVHLSEGMQLYALVRPIVMRTLAQIQDNDADLLGAARGMFQDGVGRLEQLMEGDDEAAPAPKDPPAPVVPRNPRKVTQPKRP